MDNTLTRLTKSELKTFWKFYLPKLARSIKVNTTATTPQDFVRGSGFGAPFGNSSWPDRAANWYAPEGSVAYHVTSGDFICPKKGNMYDLLPMFPNYVKAALNEMKTHEPERAAPTFKQPYNESNTMNNSMTNTMNKMLEKNKDAVAIAGQLSVGKTANSFFLNKLLGKFPWYAKLFSRKNDVANNPVAKIVAAQTAMTLVTHFAPDNNKLNYIAEGMVQEALVDVTLNSQMLENLIGELESLVTIPDFKD